MKYLLKNSYITLICLSLFMSFVFSSSPYAEAKTTYVTKGTAPTYEKKLKLYSGGYLKADIPLVSKLTKNKAAQNQIKREVIAQIQENAPYGYKKSSKMKVKYYIKSNTNNVLSIRAKFYSIKGTKSKYITAANFNYYTKFDNISNCILYIETVSKDIKATDNYLRKTNKKKGYGNIGINTESPFFEYYFDSKGNAIFTYIGEEIGKNNLKTYTTTIPAKYFSYNLVLNK